MTDAFRKRKKKGRKKSKVRKQHHEESCTVPSFSLAKETDTPSLLVTSSSLHVGPGKCQVWSGLGRMRPVSSLLSVLGRLI